MSIRRPVLATALGAVVATLAVAAPKDSHALMALEEAPEGGGGGGSYTTTTTTTVTQRTIYIHGRTKDNVNYWPSGLRGVNPTKITWDATRRLADQLPGIKSKLTTYCTNGVTCRVVCHSAGCLAITRILSENNNTRPWNIGAVISVAGAQGGSELAPVAKGIANTFAGAVANLIFKYTVDLDWDLFPDTARTSFAHDYTMGAGVYTVSGTSNMKYKKCKWWNVVCHGHNGLIAVGRGTLDLIFPGKHDTALALHSTASCRTKGSYSYISSCSAWTNHYHKVQKDYTHNMLSEFIAAMPDPWSVAVPSTAPGGMQAGDCTQDTEGACASLDDYGNVKYDAYGQPVNQSVESAPHKTENQSGTGLQAGGYVGTGASGDENVTTSVANNTAAYPSYATAY